MRKQNISGHKNFVKAFKPDFVKLMSDGYFFEPETAKVLKAAEHASDLRKLKPIAFDDKWIRDQVSLVKELTSSFGDEVLTFYNVFAPATAFKCVSKFLNDVSDELRFIMSSTGFSHVKDIDDSALWMGSAS